MSRSIRMEAPLLSQEGWRGDVLSAAPGWFLKRTTPSAPAKDASRRFLDGAATLPNLGGELPVGCFATFVTLLDSSSADGNHPETPARLYPNNRTPTHCKRR